MNGNVEALAYQIAELITSYQFEFWVAFKKRPEPCSFQEMCKTCDAFARAVDPALVLPLP